MMQINIWPLMIFIILIYVVKQATHIILFVNIEVVEKYQFKEKNKDNFI